MVVSRKATDGGANVAGGGGDVAGGGGGVTDEGGGAGRGQGELEGREEEE